MGQSSKTEKVIYQVSTPLGSSVLYQWYMQYFKKVKIYGKPMGVDEIYKLLDREVNVEKLINKWSKLLNDDKN